VHQPSDSAIVANEAEVRERLAWAIRQGEAHWLWPNVTIEGWQDALWQIETATRQILCEGRAKEPLAGLSRDIGIAAYTSGMGPLLGYWISRGQLAASEESSTLLQLHYRYNASRVEMLAERTLSAGAALAGNGVKVTLLKGMHTAFTCFPAPGTRPMSDIDMMIDPADQPKAAEVLATEGYRPGAKLKLPDEQLWRHEAAADFPRSLSLAHPEDPWGIDLHTSANRRYAPGSPIIRFDDLLRQTTPEAWPLAHDIQVMSPAATVLFLACHAGCGLSNLRMLRLAELVLFIRHAGERDRLSWDAILTLGTQTATLPGAYAALRLSDALAPGTVPHAVLTECEACAPKAVSRVVQCLVPATAHRFLGWSMEERYMWTTSLRGKIGQLIHEIAPTESSFRNQVLFYKRRLFRVLRGRLSFTSSFALPPGTPPRL
jgi:hypothetical protein